jgi:hypothetical protein
VNVSDTHDRVPSRVQARDEPCNDSANCDVHTPDVMPKILCKCMNAACPRKHFSDYPEKTCNDVACYGNHLWVDGDNKVGACYGAVEEENR